MINYVERITFRLHTFPFENYPCTPFLGCFRISPKHPNKNPKGPKYMYICIFFDVYSARIVLTFDNIKREFKITYVRSCIIAYFVCMAGFNLHRSFLQHASVYIYWHSSIRPLMSLVIFILYSIHAKSAHCKFNSLCLLIIILLT